ncbi:hypothetical protein GeomeDRAFT_3342 [Geobacter metallireducens RCH3]|uniref:Lipoprotein, putative n=1 Tax=Geobacter metallireducens (strain ATCC 53774 / DSM 7210 / GS-15) TaxID=269799 RepID=J9JEP7_GEOMG|nr:hypothetical protein [Geobacter metallireducens]AFR42863.1 lipoprotein, putative [Geobacter metallireducens GS-15]EHP83957.1 hypothetical protein GeomeDRAFT_3342 [Geobacter metallireducens RCH3]
MKKQVIMGLVVVVMGAMLVAGCNKAPEGYTADGQPAKALKKGELPKAGPEKNMLDYYKGKK